MPALHKVRHISSPASQLADFVVKVNHDIDELNKLIAAYKSGSSNDPIVSLKAIFHYKRLIENKYSENHISACPDFLKRLEQKLFPALKREFAKHGITDLYGIVDPLVPPAANAFSKILTNMEPLEVNKLMTILSQGSAYSRDELSALYPPASNPEYDAFIRNNAISFLGGNNSKNFKITPHDGSKPYVVKVEYRMGMPKLPAVHLKERALKETILPVMAERMGTMAAGVGTVTRTILVTEYSANGDLNAHSLKHSNNFNTQTAAALDVYRQMAAILISIEESGCAFPDMKNSNWLIDQNGRVVLADTKAFIFCDRNGKINYAETIAITGGSFVQSEFFNPPEFYSQLAVGVPISADKMHAFILGKNIYQYLTHCDDSELHQLNDASYFDFNDIVFETNEGQQLKELIGHLVRANPEDRISLAEAMHKLDNIGLVQGASKEVRNTPSKIIKNDSVIDAKTAAESHKKFKASLESLKTDDATEPLNSQRKNP